MWCEIFNTSPFDKHEVDVARNNRFRKNVLCLLAGKCYCNTLPTSLLVDQRDMIFITRRFVAYTALSVMYADYVLTKSRDCYQCVMFIQDILATLTLPLDIVSLAYYDRMSCSVDNVDILKAFGCVFFC